MSVIVAETVRSNAASFLVSLQHDKLCLINYERDNKQRLCKQNFYSCDVITRKNLFKGMLNV